MADLFADLGLNKEEVASEAGTETVGGTMIDSGVYKMKVDKMYVATTEKEAKMLTLELVDTTNPKTVLKYATCIKSGTSNKDASKHYKSTYTKNNKEFPLPGVIEMSKIQQALGNIEFTTTPTEIDGKDGKQSVEAILTATGKIMTVGVKQELGEYSKNFISTFLNQNGENSKGENLVEKLAESIAKNPTKTPKDKGGASNAGGSAQPKAEAPKGW